MKHIALIAAACAALVSFAGDPAPGLTTNLVVYTNVHSPSNTSHYFATRLNLKIRNGLVVGCRDEGVFDLFNGLPAAESGRVAAERRREYEERMRDLRERRESRKKSGK